jgi:hypothetical protein
MNSPRESQKELHRSPSDRRCHACTGEGLRTGGAKQIKEDVRAHARGLVGLEGASSQ